MINIDLSRIMINIDPLTLSWVLKIILRFNFKNMSETITVY